MAQQVVLIKVVINLSYYKFSNRFKFQISFKDKLVPSSTNLKTQCVISYILLPSPEQFSYFAPAINFTFPPSPLPYFYCFPSTMIQVSLIFEHYQ